MTELKFGHLIDADEPVQRDAVHVAVAPVVAAETLAPGTRVGFAHVGNTELVTSRVPVHHTIGVIDPFLCNSVQPGQRCWLFVFPNTITALRHEWTHPAFATAPTDPPSSRRAVNLEGVPATTAVPNTDVESLAGRRSSLDERRRSEAWLRRFAVDVGVSYDVLMEAAATWLDTGRAFCLGWDTPGVVWEERENFWRHYQRMTDRAPRDRDETFFVCAC